MATKKNPLSALLRSDERQQAEAFTRDHVTRSAVRQAGTYRVTTQELLPISQTSLGRMASSLGTVSGILNQFSEYQTKKEQAELQGDRIKHQITMQGFASKRADDSITVAQERGKQLDATVAKQNEQLELTQQQTADAKWDAMYDALKDPERRAMEEKANEQVWIAENAKRAAELGIELRNPYEHTESPLYGERALSHIGGGQRADFDAFFRAKEQEFIDTLEDHPNGAALTREQAFELAEQALPEFMKKQGLDPSGPVGRGFLEATQRLRSTQVPTLVNKLLAKSEVLNTQNLVQAMKNFADDFGKVIETGDGSVVSLEESDVTKTEWYAQLSGMSQQKALGAMFGSQGDPTTGEAATPGLYGVMTATHEGAVRFQMLFDQMADKYQMNGKPFSEYEGFDALQASVEEAVVKGEIKEVTEKDNAYRLAQKAVVEPLQQIGARSFDELDRRAMNLVKADDTPDEMRARLMARFPELADTIATVTDDRIFRFANYLTKQVRGISGDRAASTARLLATASKNYNRADEAPGLVRSLLSVKMLADSNPGAQTSPISLLAEAFISGQGLTGGLGLSNKDGGFLVRELDDFTKGAITTYTRGLNNLDETVQSGLPDDASVEQYHLAFNEGLSSLDKNLEESLMAAFTKHTEDNRRFLAAVDLVGTDHGAALRELSKDKDFEGVEDALLYDRGFLKGVMVGNEGLNMPGNKSLTFKEALEFTRYHKKLSQKPSTEVLATSFPEDPADAKTITNSYAIQKAITREQALDVLYPGGAQHKQIEMLSTQLAKDHYPILNDGAVKRYKALMVKANEAAAGDLSYEVTPGQVAEITTGCFPDWNQPSLQSTQRMVVIGGDDYVKMRPRADKGDYPTGHARRIAPVKQDFEGNPITHSDWRGIIRQDVTVGGDFFVVKQTPITGLPFGNEPPVEGDIDGILRTVGWDKRAFRAIYYKYGFEDGLTFLKSQFNNSYYTNHRVGGTTPPTYTPQSFTQDPIIPYNYD